MTGRLALALLLAAAPLSAQQDSLLLEALRLATEGQSDSARSLVRARMQGVSTTDPLYAEALYTAGRVAGSADDAVRYFRQVSIEYSDSPWADRALLALSQHAFAEGDMAAARRSAERVLLDYPLSTSRAEAAFWAGLAAMNLEEAESGCRLLDQAEREAGDNVELGNRAGFYLQRCASLFGIRPGQPDADSAAAQPSRTGRVIYRVQVAAVSTAAAADEAMRQISRAGYTATVFRDEDGLLKVRIGRYTRRADADALARELRQRLGGRPFVVEERQ